MEEYYLLYYEWKYVEEKGSRRKSDSQTGKLQNDLIYCVSLGELLKL